MFDEEDDVMNYMVTEAVVIEYGRYRLQQEKSSAEKQQQEEWKRGKPGEASP